MMLQLHTYYVIDRPLVVLGGIIWGIFPCATLIYLALAIVLQLITDPFTSVHGIAHAVGYSWILNFVWCSIGLFCNATQIILYPRRGRPITFIQSVHLGWIAGFWIGVEVWMFASISLTIYLATMAFPKYANISPYAGFLIAYHCAVVFPILVIAANMEGLVQFRVSNDIGEEDDDVATQAETDSNCEAKEECSDVNVAV